MTTKTQLQDQLKTSQAAYNESVKQEERLCKTVMLLEERIEELETRREVELKSILRGKDRHIEVLENEREEQKENIDTLRAMVNDLRRSIQVIMNTELT